MQNKKYQKATEAKWSFLKLIMDLAETSMLLIDSNKTEGELEDWNWKEFKTGKKQWWKTRVKIFVSLDPNENYGMYLDVYLCVC